MKRTIATTLAALAALAAAATDYKFDLNYPNFNCYPASNRVVKVQGLTPYVGNFISYTSDASGVFYMSNISVGDWSAVVQPKGSAGQVQFQFTVTATNLGLVQATAATSQLGVQSYPTAGKSSWTIQASESRYVRVPTNNATASDGQVVSKTGDATKWVTGGGAGSQTPWDQNVSGAGYSLSNVLNLRATNITSRSFTNSGDARIDGDAIIGGTATLGLANIGAAATVDEDGDAYFPTLTAGGGSLTNYQTVQANTVNATRMTTSTITNTSGGAFGGDVYFSSKITAGLADIGLATIDEDGDAYFPTIAGDGSGITNVPSKFFATIAAMTNAAGVADQLVYVDSYWSNWFGGGAFKWESGTATIDNGLVFAAPSGRWRRLFPAGWPTNTIAAEWFGVFPNNAGDVTTALRDQSPMLQAAIDATPKTDGVCLVPDFGITITNSLVISNWSGGYFGGRPSAQSPGFRTWPNWVPVLNWNGATGATMVKIHDVRHSTFANFGLDTRPPTSNTAYWTNVAMVGLDVDMKAGHTTTTTADFFKGLCIRERGTNTGFEAVRLAYTSADNVEFMDFSDCQFTGTGGNIPLYWMSTTNSGGNIGIRVGGGGGGANSFAHTMRNCNFVAFQYFVYSDSAGNWDITANRGTAAGVAAYYLNGTGPSTIRFTRNEGDRRFLVSPSVHPVILEANEIAQSYSLSVSNVEAVDGVNLTLRGNRWNTDSSGVTRSVTNSFNATGWYSGANNKFTSSSSALFPAGKFLSGFNSTGDFGTTATNAWLTKFPLMTYNGSLADFQTVATYNDVGTPTLTLMPDFGNVKVGSGASSVNFSVYSSNTLGVAVTFGDATIANRYRGLSANGVSEWKSTGTTSGWLEAISDAARVDLYASTLGVLNFRTGGGAITVNDTSVATFGTDFKIKFPYDTSFEVVGPIYANTLRATNHITWFTNNSFSSLSSTPVRYGQASVVNSNGVLWQVTATTSGTLAWSTTNQLGSGGGGGGSQTPWTSDINAATYKLTNISYASFSGGVVLDKDGAQNNGYVSSVVTAIGGRSNLIQGSASSVDNVVLEGRSNVFNIQSSVAVGNAIIAGSSNLLNNPALATVRNSVILGGHGNNIQGASDALVAGSGSVVQSGHNGTFVLSDSQNTATLSQNSDTLLLRFQNGVGINTNNPGTNALFVIGSQTVSSNLNVSGIIRGNGSGITGQYGFGTNTLAANSWSNTANHNFTGNVTVSGTLIAGSLQSTLGGSATIWDHTSFAGASAGQELFDAFAIAGNKVFGIQSQPNDVQQPTNIFFRVDYPTKQKYGLGSFATNYIANANTAGYTNSRAAPGIGGTNNMVARVVGTSGTLEFYNRSGEYGVTVCGVGVFTNTISSSTWHIPIPVNSGFIIRSGSGVDIQVYAQ